MIKRAILLCGILFGCVAQAQAQNVYFDRVWVDNLVLPGGSFGLWGSSLGPNRSGGDVARADFSIDNNLLMKYLGDPSIVSGGPGSGFAPRIYFKVVNDGDILDFASMSPSNPSGFPYQLILDKPFLVGVGMGINYAYDFGFGLTIGWARLQYTSSGLTVLDSAVANQDFGIIAGTTTVVPEPATICLALSAIISLALLRRYHSGETKHCH
jgi:hypothetical protein